MPDLESLAKQLRESYGLNMPTDIWESAAEAANPFTRAHNMLDLRDAFPAAFLDSIGLVEASLAAMPGEWYGISPRLDFVFRSMNQLPAQVHEISEYLMRARANHDAYALGLLNAEVLRKLTHNPDWHIISESQRDTAIRSGRINLTKMLDKNLSQTVRFEQERVWKENYRTFFGFARRFHDWASQLGIQYSLRHPLAMNNSFFHTLESMSDLGGIPLPAMYYTQTQGALLDDLTNTDNLGLFFDVPRGGNQAIQYHNIYHEWSRLNAYAHAQWQIGSSVRHTAIIPACLPPWLIRAGDSVLPIYARRPTPALSFAEQIVHYNHVTPDSLESGVEYPFDIDELEWLGKVGRALSILTVGITLYASTIRLGSGHKRPTWIRTPMNLTLLSTFERALNEESKLYV